MIKSQISENKKRSTKNLEYELKCDVICSYYEQESILAIFSSN